MVQSSAQYKKKKMELERRCQFRVHFYPQWSFGHLGIHQYITVHMTQYGNNDRVREGNKEGFWTLRGSLGQFIKQVLKFSILIMCVPALGL